MRILSLILVVTGLMALIVLAVGYTAEEAYTGETFSTYDNKIGTTWEALTTVEIIPKAKRGVERVEIIARDKGLVTWKEYLEDGGYRLYRMVSIKEPDRYVVEMLDSSDGVTGFWDFRLEQQGHITKVTVREQSKTADIWIRGLHTFVGRNIQSRRDLKTLRTALFQDLLNSV